MSSLIGALPFPAVGERPRARTRVDHKNSEEAALVRRVQARDELAFREIVERYQAKVFSIIYGILRNHNDAEDIAQQVFRKFTSPSATSTSAAHCSPGSTKSRSMSVTIICAKSGSGSWFTKAIFRKRTPPAWRPPTRRSIRPCRWTEAGAAGSGDEASRQGIRGGSHLILLKEVEGHSVEELAAMTGLNENTIKVKLFRTRQKLLKAAQRLSRTRPIVK